MQEQQEQQGLAAQLAVGNLEPSRPAVPERYSSDDLSDDDAWNGRVETAEERAQKRQRHA
jgi:hypothetical protein